MAVQTLLIPSTVVSSFSNFKSYTHTGGSRGDKGQNCLFSIILYQDSEPTCNGLVTQRREPQALLRFVLPVVVRVAESGLTEIGEKGLYMQPHRPQTHLDVVSYDGDISEVKGGIYFIHHIKWAGLVVMQGKDLWARAMEEQIIFC